MLIQQSLGMALGEDQKLLLQNVRVCVCLNVHACLQDVGGGMAVDSSIMDTHMIYCILKFNSIECTDSHVAAGA